MDFRLKVFICVAHTLNFTKASQELFISQPAVSKHIQELETIYGIRLFDRGSGKISLTTAGEIFLKNAEHIVKSYQMLSLEMDLLKGRISGSLRVGASTTIAQYVLPEIIAKFIKRFPDVQISMFNGNSEEIESALLESKIDIGFVESSSRHQGIHYTNISKDELVLVTSTKNRAKSEITAKELALLPLVLRETGSGTLDVIVNALSKKELKLSQMNILLQLDNTESIKSFIANYPTAYAIISIAALGKELIQNTLKVVEIVDMNMDRDFTLATLHGYKHYLAEKFISLI